MYEWMNGMNTVDEAVVVIESEHLNPWNGIVFRHLHFLWAKKNKNAILKQSATETNNVYLNDWLWSPGG